MLGTKAIDTVMRTPVRVTFRGLAASDELEQVCWREAQKLVKHYDRLSGFDVLLRAGRTQSGNHVQFEARVVLRLPRTTIAAEKSGALDEEPAVVIRACFERAGRQLHDHIARQRSHRSSTQAS